MVLHVNWWLIEDIMWFPNLLSESVHVMQIHWLVTLWRVEQFGSMISACWLHVCKVGVDRLDINFTLAIWGQQCMKNILNSSCSRIILLQPVTFWFITSQNELLLASSHSNRSLISGGDSSYSWVYIWATGLVWNMSCRL